MLIGFERWYTRHLAGDAHEHLPGAETVTLLTVLFDRSRGALLVPRADVLDDLLAAVDADQELAPRMPEVIDTLEHYLDFAVESGAWPATDAQIDESSEVLEVAFELSTGLLVFLLDSLDDVDEATPELSRLAFEAMAGPVRTPSALVSRLRGVLAIADSQTTPGALAVERVLGLLCVAADPALLPGRSGERIRAMLDTAAGVTPDEARDADPATERMLAELEHDGILRVVETSGVVRHEAPIGLRPALADAIIEVADELGLLEDEGFNPHPDGAALQVKVAVVGSAPAEWRRLLLAADSDLGELHLAAQLSLDWPNTEPHEFTLADEPDAVFTSFDRVVGEPDSVREDAVDENDVQLGELLAEVGDELRYRYGVDETRRLVVRLESVVEADQRPLPRCVGAAAGVDVAEIDRLLSPLRLR
jgi:hypothetical protein